MDFFAHGIHLHKALVHKKSCPSLINYGCILSKWRLDCCLKIACRDLRMKKFKPFQIMQEKEKEEEILVRKIMIEH